MAEKSESYRLQMLRRLQNRYSQGDPPEVLEAEETIAKFREQKARDREAIKRLSAPLPEPNLCPECWFIHGRTSPLRAVPHPEPKKFDRFVCDQCNYVDDRPGNPFF
ncbi:MAG: hypothetical protein KGM47_15270 [Acidobacteriota bacterium]|nr:hypothetical protein [Acidobacteriota bacterium]